MTPEKAAQLDLAADFTPSTPATRSSSQALLEAERERLERFAHDQFEQIRQARAALVAEQRASRQALEERRKELDHQSQAVLERLQECHEREKKLAQQQDPAQSDSAENTRKQIHELQYRLELLEAERDAAWMQVHQLREQVEQTTSPPSDASEQASELRTRVADLEKDLESAHAESNLLREERDAACERLMNRSRLSLAQDSDINLGGAPGDGLQHTNLGLAEDKFRICELTEERDFALQHLARLQDQLRQVGSEKDCLQEQVQQLTAEPERWAGHEEEVAAMRRQLQQERKKLAGETQAVYEREAKLKQNLDEARAALEQERAEFYEAYDNWWQQLEQERQWLEEQMREQQRREAELHERELELTELKERTERDSARDSSELTQVRLRIARLCESLRLELESLDLLHAESQQ